MPDLHLEDTDYHYIMAVLSERPYKEVYQLIAKIVSQQQQQRPPFPLAVRPKSDGQAIEAPNGG